MRTPDISTPKPTPLRQTDANEGSYRPASLADSLPNLHNAPAGWHTDDQVGDHWHPNSLAGYHGDAWVPPAITAPGIITAPALASPVPTKTGNRSRVIAIATGVAVLAILAVAMPRLTGTGAGPARSNAVTTPLLDTEVAASVPETNAQGATALALAADRRSRTKVFGTETNFGRNRTAAASTLDYALSFTPDSVRVVAPEMLNGVTHSHLTAETDALVLAERWPKTEAAQSELAKAIDGKFPLDLWLDPSGNLAKLTIHTTNDGSGSEIEVVYE